MSTLKDKKIAVIGAGLAGLTAAYRLQQSGLSVDVFEARNRVGGRVFTALMKNYLGETTEVELGAQNIADGGKAEHFMALVQEFGLEVKSYRLNLDVLVHFDGNYADFDELIRLCRAEGRGLAELAKTIPNIGGLIDAWCGKHLALRQALLTLTSSYEGVDAYEQSIKHGFGFLSRVVSGKSDKSDDGEARYVPFSSIQGGNARLPQALAEPLQSGIRFNKVLKSVQASNHSVQLSFSDGSNHSYDYVVLAIPASVFKELDLSESGIEPDRLTRINRVQYGDHHKILTPLNLAGKNRYECVATRNALSFFNHDGTVVAIYGNKRVPRIAEVSKIIAKGMGLSINSLPTRLLQADDGQQYLNYAESVMHDWVADPYSRGSYSGRSIAEPLDVVEHHDGTSYQSLFAPVRGRLFFAGEHTTTRAPLGTMEAAVESGDRVAEALIGKLSGKHQT